jgi:large subunit ribosomal protein L13
MKVLNVNTKSLIRNWFIVDADNMIIGRIASRIALVLRGKHKPIFMYNVDVGDFVIVINAEKAKFTSDKESKKKYFRYTGYIGGCKVNIAKDQLRKYPERVIVSAIRGMLPRGALGRKILKKLKVYKGSLHPHLAQKPKLFNYY